MGDLQRVLQADVTSSAKARKLDHACGAAEAESRPVWLEWSTGERGDRPEGDKIRRASWGLTPRESGSHSR